MKLMRFMLPLALIAAVACNNNKKDQPADGASTPATTETPAESTPGSPAGNVPKEYKVKFASDTAILGKEKQILISLKPSSNAIALQDPDGKDLGTEINIRLTLTNRSFIGKGSSEHVDYPESRMQLDNGTNITAETGTDYLRAEPESTSKEETWTFKVPAGAKPKSFTLHSDGIRATVGVTIE